MKKSLFFFRRSPYLLLAAVMAITISAKAQNTREPARRSGMQGVPTKKISVSGTVMDAKGPLAGVSVSEAGASGGALTDAYGRYTLMVSGLDAVLHFSYIGYVSREIAVAGKEQLTVTLEADVQNLSSVVVTALGIERKERALGYAVQEVQGADLVKARETNLVNALAARVAGVNIGRVPGAIGSSARIVIRGENSLNGSNQALFVVDGIPIDNEMRANRSQLDFGNGAGEINPDDIATISVLKGPAAAALYGSRGANGVVLITTKKGKTGSGAGVSVNSTTSFELPMLRWDLQNEYGQGSGGIYTIGLGGRSWGPKFNPDTLIAQVDPSQYPLEGQDGKLLPWVPQPDNVIDFFRTGQTFTNNIAYGGNSEKADYRISYTNLYQTSMAPNMSLKRNTMQFNGGYRILPSLELRTSFSYINTNSPNRTGSGGQGNDNLLYSFLTGGRQTNLDRIRNYWVDGYEGIQQWSDNFRVMNNPYFSVYEIINSQNKNRLVGNASLRYQFTKGLSLMVRTGTDWYTDQREERAAFSSLSDPSGAYRINNLQFNERNTDFLLTYNREIAGNWAFRLSAGGNQMTQRSTSSFMAASQLNIPGIYNAGNVKGTLEGGNTLTKRKTNSLYAFGNISYKDMLFLDITGRSDWSSTLPVQNNSYFYPSVSLSAVISDLFNIPSHVISFAKLRASVAQAGNDMAPYQTVQNFSYGTPWGGTQTLQESGTITSKDLKPEITTNLELGMDLRFLQNRLRMDVTYYDNTTKNQILSVNLTAPTGYSSKRINAGKIQSKGVEIIIGATPVQQANGLNWDITLNWSANRSKVLELAEDIESYSMAGGGSASVLAKVGERMGDVYARDLLRNENGDIIYKNGLPQWTTGQVNMGNYNPDWMAGISNTFSYKGFHLGVLLDIRQGGVIYSHTYRMGKVWGQFTETLEGREGIIGKGVKDDGTGKWVPNDVEITGQTYWGNGGGMTSQAGTSILDASFVKLREVQLGYSLKGKRLNSKFLQNLSLTLVARNLFTWTNSPHIDPDNVQISGNSFAPGGEMIALPQARSIGINLSCNF